MIRSLYLHIPFCERKCEYCDFVSVAGSRGSSDYVEALRTEITSLASRFPNSSLDTVFIGGGTPSLVEPQLIGRILDTVAAGFHIAPDAEISMEANPSSTSVERARTWRHGGVNRVSLGVQSLDAPTLQYLGRVHDAQRALAAVEELRAAGFESVNCDLIYAVPGLATQLWIDNLQRIVAANPDHISCYELTVEPGTPLHTRVRRGLTTVTGDLVALEQHAVAVSHLAAAGYAQYEVSNFARPGHECRHNLAYWHNRHYLAAGVGAHGHIPAALAPALDVEVAASAVSLRYWHGRGIAAYTAAARDGRLPVAAWEEVDERAARAERLLLGLRLTRGVTVSDSSELEELVRGGFVRRRGSQASVTPRGEAVLNSVVERLVAADEALAPCYK